jgi:hypothetical protein
MNYNNAFILIADDCLVEEGVVLEAKEVKTKPIHLIQYELMSKSPYKYNQEDILFLVYAERNKISKTNKRAREKFFEKSHPCLRSSALSKKYGWGVHFDKDGKAALYSGGSKEYFKMSKSKDVKVVKAMRNKRP